MTDRELMQQALDLLDDINQCSLPPTGIPLPAEIDHVMEALRARLAQPEQEPVATLFGSLPVYDVPPAKPVAWVENLENARPHCVTDLKYCSVAQHERGEHLKYIPLYTAPLQREWQGLTDEEIRGFEIWLDDEEEKHGWNPPADIVKYIEAKLRAKNGV